MRLLPSFFVPSHWAAQWERSLGASRPGVFLRGELTPTAPDVTRTHRKGLSPRTMLVALALWATRLSPSGIKTLKPQTGCGARSLPAPRIQLQAPMPAGTDAAGWVPAARFFPRAAPQASMPAAALLAQSAFAIPLSLHHTFNPPTPLAVGV